MKLCSIAVSTIMALLPIVGAAQPGRFTTNLGEGNTSCGEWTDKRKAEPGRVIPEASWILGYLTAASNFRSSNTPDFTSGVRGSATDHWVDSYCATHPLDDIQAAAQALAVELIQRARRNSN